MYDGVLKILCIENRVILFFKVNLLFHTVLQTKRWWRKTQNNLFHIWFFQSQSLSYTKCIACASGRSIFMSSSFSSLNHIFINFYTNHQDLNRSSSSGNSLVNVKKKNHRLWFYKTSWIGVKIATCSVKKCHPGVNKRFKMESRSVQARCLSFSCELSATTCGVSRTESSWKPQLKNIATQMC